MGQAYEGNDPNFSQDWWDLICESPGRILAARERSRAIREGRIPQPPPHDFGDIIRRTSPIEEEPAPAPVKREPYNPDPGGWRNEQS